MHHRILVVDDEESIRVLLQDYLETQGYRVFGAADGVAGIRMFETCKPHLAIIDFLLPRKNGFAVADAIRRDNVRSDIPLVMMSGVFKNPKTAVEAREKYQVLEFLSKPLDLPTLGALVMKGLEGVPPDDEVVDAPEPRAPSEDDAFLEMEEAVARAAIGSTSQGGPGALQAVPAEPAAPAATAAARPPPRGLSYFPGQRPAPPARAPSRGPSADSLERGFDEDGIFRGRPFPVLEEEGAIEQLPVALLLSTIRYDRSTGMLDMTDSGGTHRRIYIINGNPTFMQSNAEGENVGALLLRRGRITEPDFERCLRYMKDKSRTLQQSLLELRLVSEHDLATAYKLLAGQLLPLALGMSSGTYRWRETDAFVGRVPEGKFEPVTTLFEGIKRHVHPPTILKFFKGREDVPLVRTGEFDRLMPFFRRSFSANNVAQGVDGSATYRVLNKLHKGDTAQVVPQLFALVTSGMAVLPEVDEDNAMAVAVNVAAAEVGQMSALDDAEADLEIDFEDDSGGVSADRDGRRAQAIIRQYHDKIMSQTFFEIFEATPSTDPAEIKSRYFDMAKRWHIDAFTGQDLGPAARLLDDVFGRITEAYETITDKSRREEYQIFLDRKARGLPTDVNEIMRSEQLYEQSLAMIRRRDFEGARPVLDEALRINPDPVFRATLGWVVFNQNPRAQQAVTDAVRLLRKAIQEQDSLSVAYQYLGHIAFARGALPEARKWWQRCLEWEPNNTDAARGLRMVSQKMQEREAGGSQASQRGLLSKFMKEEGG